MWVHETAYMQIGVFAKTLSAFASSTCCCQKWGHMVASQAMCVELAEITINQIMDEYTDDSGSKTVYGIDFVWGGGRPAFVRMERIMPPAAPDTSAADKGTVT